MQKLIKDNSHYHIRYNAINSMKFQISIIFYMLFLSCASNNSHSPVWLNNRPLSEKSWYGIGICEVSDKNYQETAKTIAVNEIASQISISIESSFKNITTETNLDISQYSEFIIESRVGITLPEVRIVDSCSKDDKYYIFMELKKEDFYREIELKKQKAINTVVDYLTKSTEVITMESFHYLSESLKEITPYIDLPLQTEFPKGSGKTVNILSQILIMAGDLSGRLKLIGDTNEIQTTIGMKRSFEFPVTCIDKKTGNPIANFPLKASMNGNRFTDKVTTNAGGSAKFTLFKVIDRTPVQYFIINPDISDYQNELNLTSGNSYMIKVNARPPIVYLDITEKNLDNVMDSPFVMPAIKELFVQYYSAEFTKNEKHSDFRVIGIFGTNAKSSSKNKYGLYQVYADGTLQIYGTASNTEIYQKSINNVMGADFQTLEGAGRNALKKITDKITNESFQEIIDNLDDF